MAYELIGLPYSPGEIDFPVRLSWLVRANLNSHFPIQPLEKIQELICGKPAEVSVHQMRHVRLRDTEKRRNFALLELSVFQDFEYVEADLRPREKFIGVFQFQIGKHVARAFLEYNVRVFTVHLSPIPPLLGIAF